MYTFTAIYCIMPLPLSVVSRVTPYRCVSVLATPFRSFMEAEMDAWYCPRFWYPLPLVQLSSSLTELLFGMHVTIMYHTVGGFHFAWLL